MFTHKTLLLEVTIAPLPHPNTEERAGQGTEEPSNIQSLFLFLERKAIFYFEIAFNYKSSILNCKDMQLIWIISINKIC